MFVVVAHVQIGAGLNPEGFVLRAKEGHFGTS
jgi:hypothetical protein